MADTPATAPKSPPSANVSTELAHAWRLSMQKSIAMKIQRRKIFLPQTSLLRFGPAGITTCLA